MTVLAASIGSSADRTRNVRGSPTGNAERVGRIPFSSKQTGVDYGNMRLRPGCSGHSALLLDCPGRDSHPTTPAAAASQGLATSVTTGASLKFLLDITYNQRFWWRLSGHLSMLG